jgi:hypothetical protein
VPFVLEVEQVLAELLLRYLIGRPVEVGAKLPDGAELGFLSSLSEPGELEVLVHALSKQSDHEWVLSRRRGEKSSGTHSVVATVACQSGGHLQAKDRREAVAESRGPKSRTMRPRSGLPEQRTKSDTAKRLASATAPQAASIGSDRSDAASEARSTRDNRRQPALVPARNPGCSLFFWQSAIEVPAEALGDEVL